MRFRNSIPIYIYIHTYIHIVTLFGISVARQMQEKLSGFKSGHYGLFTAIGVVLIKHF